MPIYNIEVPHIRIERFNVSADTWQEAVEKASDLADEMGLNTAGAVSVYDAQLNPVDTWNT